MQVFLKRRGASSALVLKPNSTWKIHAEPFACCSQNACPLGVDGGHGRSLLREPDCHDNLASAGVLKGQCVARIQHVFMFAMLFTTYDPPLIVWQSPAPAALVYQCSLPATASVRMGYSVAATVKLNEMQSP